MTLNKTALIIDAKNRGWRAFLQGLGIDILVAVALFVTITLTEVQLLEEIKWGVILFGLSRTVLSTAAAYIMRRWMDPSRIPTPLPPDPPGEPNADVQINAPRYEGSQEDMARQLRQTDHSIHRYDPDRKGGEPERRLEG